MSLRNSGMQECTIYTLIIAILYLYCTIKETEFELDRYRFKVPEQKVKGHCQPMHEAGLWLKTLVEMEVE